MQFTMLSPTLDIDALTKLVITETKKNAVKESKRFSTKERSQEKICGSLASSGTHITGKSM
jgi:hypothetical protein